MKITTIYELIFKDDFFGKEETKCFSSYSELWAYIKEIMTLSLQDTFSVRTYVIKEEAHQFSDLPKEIKK